MKVLAYPAYKNTHVNPYTRLLYDAMPDHVTVQDMNLKDLLLGSFDLVHLHWAAENITRRSNSFISFSYSLCFLSLLSLNKLLKGKRIVESEHDNKAHNIVHPKVYEFTRKWLDHIIDDKIPVQMYHGHYADYYENTISREQARQSLGVSKPCIMFFGMIEPYKNLDALIEAYKPISDDYHLIVAGCCQDLDMFGKLLELAKMPNVTVQPSFIPEHGVQVYFNACDLVVLPFKEVLNSGSTILSLSFNKPVLVPAKGNLGQLYLSYPDWVNLYEGKLTSQMIVETCDRLPSRDIDLTALNWKKFAKEIHDHHYT